jgi:Mg-chelatase subunit ChlI
MNPEEGDLRPQLLDRFALSVNIRGIRTTRERVLIMERNLAFEADPEAFREQWLEQEFQLSQKIKQARQLLPEVQYADRDLVAIAALSSSLNVDGHRADLVILKTARAHAACEGRTAINRRDISLAAELAYPHRLKRGPFQQAEISAGELQERIDQLQGGAAEGNEAHDEEGGEDSTQRGEPEDSREEGKKKA